MTFATVLLGAILWFRDGDALVKVEILTDRTSEATSGL